MVANQTFCENMSTLEQTIDRFIFKRRQNICFEVRYTHVGAIKWVWFGRRNKGTECAPWLAGGAGDERRPVNTETGDCSKSVYMGRVTDANGKGV